MKPKHTPAPWIHDCSEIIDERCLRVCRFADYGAPSPEDMSVILAAPEMLRLLRLLARIPLEQANLGIGPQTWIKATRKLLKELDGEA